VLFWYVYLCGFYLESVAMVTVEFALGCSHS